MSPRDTQAQFRTTAWSQLEAALSSRPEHRAKAFADLFRTYSQPIYAYLRTRYKMHDHEARDLTQEFFLWTLESEFFQKADRSRGSFRNLLKRALKNFRTNQHRKGHSLKRGGEQIHYSLELILDEGSIRPAQGKTPDEVLDDEWRFLLIKEALVRLRKKELRQGKVIYADVLEEYYAKNLTCRQIALQLGISSHAAEKRLSDGRKRLSEFVSDLVAETVASPEDLKLELETLFGRPSSKHALTPPPEGV